MISPDQCDVWPHPIARAERVTVDPPLGADHVRIGFLGFAKRQKGFDDYLELLASTDQQGANWCEFRLVGSIAEATYGSPPAKLVIVPGIEDRAKYVEGVRSVDYAYTFLDDQTYRLTSSSSVIDAIAALRPMIGLDTATVRAMSEGHEVGYFCRTKNELHNLVVNRDVLFDTTRYHRFQKGLRALGAARAPAELSKAIARTVGGSLRAA